MKRKLFTVTLLFAAITAFSGCNGSDASTPGANLDNNPPANGDPTANLPPSALPPTTEASQADLLMLNGRSFQQGGSRYAPADFQQVDLALKFDPRVSTAVGTATIRFNAIDDAIPYFRLTPDATAAKLDGQDIRLSRITDPNGVSRFVALETPATKGSSHTLELSYALSSDDVSYRTGGVGFVTSMADIDNGNFFEAYGPANFEADRFKLNVDLSIDGATHAHQLFTNGTATQQGDNRWRIEFPEWFMSSSFYFHVTDANLTVRRTTYAGLDHQIPITIYSQTAYDADSAFSKINNLFHELEGDYGPFLHQTFTAYISGAGGMEHNGATITSVSALGHELLHSWFARGVMPSDGRSGWFDESVASWRDNDYPRANLRSRSAESLGNGSIFDFFTPYRAYAAGSTLLSELDSVFAPSKGGVKPVLKDFFAVWKTRTISTDVVQKFFEADTGKDLNSYFQRYVLGDSSSTGQIPGVGVPGEAPGAPQPPAPITLHPPALTKDEVRDLR